jgi:hypothetical protein
MHVMSRVRRDATGVIVKYDHFEHLGGAIAMLTVLF